ncbi:MAG TPA: hypothetical protein VK543_16005 [Puia sp.]|nr:hypothetical protein [Puia sp.]
MKTKHISWLSFLSLSIQIMTIAGCKQPSTGYGNIPVNEDSIRRHILPIADAIEYTKNFRTARDTFYNQLPPMKNGLNFGQGEAFNRDAIAVLLNQKDSAGHDAAGVRIYYGLDRSGSVRMVLVPYDGQGNDIINKLVGDKSVKIPGIASAYAEGSGGQTIEAGQRCPTVCSSTGGLSGQ